MRWLVLLFVIACGGGPKAGGTAGGGGDDVSKCEARDGEACTRLGIKYQPEPRGTGGNAPLSFSYFKKACAAKSWKGCTELGSAYLRGRGTPEDKVAAATHFELACSHDYAMGCWSRARMWHNWLRSCNPAYNEDGYKRPRECKGHVIESNNKAVELLRRACRLKDDTSCKVVAAYDEKPGAVRVKIDDEFSEDWAFESPAEGEPDWGD